MLCVLTAATDASHMPIRFLCAICDVISGLAFGWIFIYNAFGPNRHLVYMIADIDTRQKSEAVEMLVRTVGVGSCSCGPRATEL